MLTRAMITASASRRVHEVDELVELRGLGVGVLLTALHLSVGVCRGDGLESGVQAGRIASPGAAFDVDADVELVGTGAWHAGR